MLIRPASNDVAGAIRHVRELEWDQNVNRHIDLAAGLLDNFGTAINNPLHTRNQFSQSVPIPVPTLKTLGDRGLTPLGMPVLHL